MKTREDVDDPNIWLAFRRRSGFVEERTASWFGSAERLEKMCAAPSWGTS
jgi:hypothetical protein